MRRSVVVGLGYASEPVLAHIAAEFRARGAAAWNGPAGAGEFDEIDDQGMTGDLRLLWLLPGSPYAASEAMPDPVPVTGPGDRIDLAPFALDLALTPADLSKLYYQPEVCTWSGPNWREWGDAIRYNRLLGRLALYHHRRRVGDRVIALINHLSRQDSLPLNLYLVAPLVDPFASGAMLDVAYLLDRIAVNRNARVYGLLVLPDTAGLPFWSDEQDSSPLAVSDGEGVQGDEADIAANLGYATAYAALRELNFVLGPRSFYQSHHPEPGYRIERTDESPFQSGDCYLLGGHLDEARRSIDWDTVVGQTARWVYLQTCSGLGDYLSTSETNRRMISSFGIVSPASLPGAGGGDYELYAMTLLLVQHVLNAPDRTGPSGLTGLDAARWLALREPDLDNQEALFEAMAYSSGETVRPFALRGGNRARRELDALDERYANAVDVLRDLEGALAKHRSEQQARAEETITGELAALRSRPGVTLPVLQAAHDQIAQQAARVANISYATLIQAEQNASDMATRLRRARERFLYVGRAYPFWAVALPALGIIGLVAALLYAAALPVTLILWVAVAVLVPAAVIQLIQTRRYRSLRAVVVRSQRNFLMLQRDLAYVSNLYAYQRHLETTLRSCLHLEIDDSGRSSQVLRAGHLRDAASKLAIHLRGRRVRASTVLESRLAALYDESAVRIIEALWSRLDDLLREGHRPDLDDMIAVVQDGVHGVIEDYVRARVERDEKGRLSGLVQTYTALPSTLLATKDTLIPERQRRDTDKIVRVVGWNRQIVSDVQDEFQSSMVRLVDLSADPAEQAANGNGSGNGNGSEGDSMGESDDSPPKRDIEAVHLRNNIPLRAVLDLDQWRMAYQKCIFEPRLDPPLTFRSFLHPTRAGIASPDIRLMPGSDPCDESLVIMAFCVLLHHTESSELERRVCHLVAVESDPRANFDELCGALQENPDILFEALFPGVDVRAADSGVPEDEIAALREAWTAIRQRNPRISYQYADWEVWTVEQIAEMLARAPAPREVRRLARIWMRAGLTLLPVMGQPSGDDDSLGN